MTSKVSFKTKFTEQGSGPSSTQDCPQISITLKLPGKNWEVDLKVARQRESFCLEKGMETKSMDLLSKGPGFQAGAPSAFQHM